MKKIISVFILSIFICSCGAYAFATREITPSEEALLDKFSSVVYTHASQFYKSSDLADDVAEQYRNEAQNALLQVDFSADAIADLSRTIDDVDEYIKDNNITTIDQFKIAAPTIVGMVNDVAGKYGITISIDPEKGFATVHISSPNSEESGAGSANKVEVFSTDKNIVRQTGMDITATIIVAGILLISLISGLAIISKKDLLSRKK